MNEKASEYGGWTDRNKEYLSYTRSCQKVFEAKNSMTNWVWQMWDWLWRICIGLSASLLVRETDIWLIADMRTNNGLIVNSIFAGLIYVLGCAPLFLKIVPLSRKKNDVRENKKNRNNRSPFTSVHANLGRESIEEEIKQMKNSFVDKDTNKVKKLLNINAPRELDYSKRCMVQWNFKEGDFIPNGHKIFSISETLGHHKEKKSFSLTADKDYRLESRNVSVTGEAIKEEGGLLCTLSVIEEKNVPTKKREVSNPQSDSQVKRRTKSRIQSDLNALKELREKGLISEEVWTEKQRDILKDY